MTSLAAIDLTSVETHLGSDELRARIIAKAVRELQDHYVAEAARTPAWPLTSEPEETPKAAWLAPGTYQFSELQNRFAPRTPNQANEPDARYFICPTVVEATVTGIVKAVLLLPEFDDVLTQATNEGLDAEQLLSLCMELIGTPLSESIAAEVIEMQTDISEEALRWTALRAALTEAAELAEKHHLEECLEANQKRFTMLTEQWKAISGPHADERITLKSPVLPLLHKWLQTLSPIDAALFLAQADVSDGVAAGQGLPPEFVIAVANATLPEQPFKPNPVYGVLRTLMSEILSIPGQRLVSITSRTGQVMRFDIDTCHRFGHSAGHLALFVNKMFEGLNGYAGVMIRAYTGTTVNVYDGEKGAFVPHPVKNLYGALLERKNYVGLSQSQVEHVHTTDAKTGKPKPHEKHLICTGWPKRV